MRTLVSAAAVALLATTSPAPGGTIDIPAIVEVGDLSSLSVSPDGRWVAFRVDQPSIADNRVHLAWYVIDTAGEQPPRRVAAGGDARYDAGGELEDEAPIWSPDSAAIYYRRADGAAVQVWRTERSSGATLRITADDGNVRTFSLSDDGARLTYRAAAGPRAVARAEEAARRDGVRMDHSIELAVGVVGGLRDNDRERNVRVADGWFGRGDLLDSRPPREMTIAVRDARVIASRQLAAWPAVPTQSPRPGSLCAAVTCPRDTVVAWRLAPTAATGGWTAYFDVTNRTTLVPDHVAAGVRRITTPALVAGSRQYWSPCAAAPGKLVCVEAAALSPPRLVTIDVRTGRRRTLFDPNETLRARTATVAHRTLRWRSHDGEEFGAHLILPQPPQPRLPLVIHYYSCGGFLRGGLGDELPILPLVTRGIAVLCINASFKPSSTPARSARYQRGLEAIETIVTKLDRNRTIDAMRVGMQGLSFGAEVTAWVVRHSKLLRAAAIASPLGDPGYYWFNAATDASFGERFTKNFGVGDPDHDPDGWKVFSPARDIESFRVPLLMQLPELEARQSAEFFAKLRASGTPTDLYIYPGANHIKSQPAQKASVYRRNLDWFRFWLTNQPESDPASVEQYARWRAMRVAFERSDRARPELRVD